MELRWYQKFAFGWAWLTLIIAPPLLLIGFIRVKIEQRK